jgi:branched-chain amino acid transport system substrate-binding protein
MNDMYLLEAKGPDEVHGPWDLLKIKATVKAADITRPLEKGGCPSLDP